ncbi:expressed unknown protein [Seminavis robusta]|uniref:Uncharacterized protein n=1 Tax=Seminavis robusta TaxID=568900 RepID=A0A9N8EY58_9STRA|nr:expressed unknown protein [Seminavis robusta]|eukprot:Sro1907_g304700.1 n/a (227) ;mRNA; f:17116-17796
MLFRSLLTVALPLLASAFGPATPLLVRNDASPLMTMRVSQGDLKRRGKITKMLDNVKSTNDPKAAIQSTVLTDKTAELLETCGENVRKSMLYKIQALSSQYGLVVPSDFGTPMPLLEREALEAQQAAVKKAEKKSHFDQFKVDRDARVAARKAAEAGTEAEKKKKVAARIAAIEAKKREKEEELKRIEKEEQLKLMATIANALEAEKEAEEKEAASSESKEVEAEA